MNYLLSWREDADNSRKQKLETKQTKQKANILLFSKID